MLPAARLYLPKVHNDAPNSTTQWDLVLVPEPIGDMRHPNQHTPQAISVLSLLVYSIDDYSIKQVLVLVKVFS